MKVAWEIQDHVCIKCSGRILKSFSSYAAGEEENAIYRCADCGNSTHGTTADEICWCGTTQASDGATGYKCMPYTILEDHPEYINSFKSCGYTPESGGEIGIMRAEDLEEKQTEKKEESQPSVIWLVKPPNRNADYNKSKNK